MAQTDVKVIIIGDYGVGKTTFIKRHINGFIAKKFLKEHGCHVHPLVFCTSKCSLELQVWDTQGQEALGALKRPFYDDALCAIMMFDVTDKASYRHLEDWHEVIRMTSKTPGRSPISIVVCGNKADLEGRVVFPRHTIFPKKYGYPYFDVSAISNYNFEAVFLSLIRQYLRIPAVSLPTASLLKPPSIPVDHQKMALLRLEWEQCLLLPLPSEDDDDFTLIRGHGQCDHLSEVRKFSSTSAHDTSSKSIAQFPSVSSQMLHTTSLIFHREQHAFEIQRGQLKNIKNILAESVAAMLSDEQVVIKHEAGDTMEGYGIRVFSDGTLYAGDFLKGNRDGVGILRWGNGDSYYGQWVDDVAHGQGLYRFSNGDSYTGKWDNGDVTGNGTFTHDDGQVFEGECTDVALIY